MSRIRPSLTYANVVATLALFLALSGGVVWAANKITSKQIGKGAVKSKNLAKGAVKNKNLAKNAVKAKNLAKKAVTSAKLGKGAVTNAKLADGAVNFAKLAAGTNLIASASGGPIPANQDGPVDIPLNPPPTITPVAGQLTTVSIEVRGKLTQAATNQCAAFFLPTVNGNPLLVGELLVLLAPDETGSPLTEKGISQGDVSFPIGLTTPGQPQTIGLLMMGDATDCTSSSVVEQVAVVATQLK
jgi:hypothetical protein